MVQSQLKDKQFLTQQHEWLNLNDWAQVLCLTMRTRHVQHEICKHTKWHEGRYVWLRKSCLLTQHDVWCVFFFLIFNWECLVWPNLLEIHQPVSHTWKCFFRFFLFWQFLWQEVLMCWNSEDRTDWHHYPKFICVCFFHSKKKLCALYGKWTECLYVVDPGAFESHKKNDKKGTEDKKGSKAVWTNFYFYLYWVDESISANYVKRNKI